MTHKEKEMKFLATPEKGEVSALLVRPGAAGHLLVLGHGASTNMRHATLQTIAERMADVGLATFRYNFPYMERGTGRDSREVCTATVRAAVAAARIMADPELIQAVCKNLGKRATFHPLDTADHGFRVLKRSRQSEEDVFAEMARIVREWAAKLK